MAETISLQPQSLVLDISEGIHEHIFHLTLLVLWHPSQFTCLL